MGVVTWFVIAAAIAVVALIAWRAAAGRRRADEAKPALEARLGREQLPEAPDVGMAPAAEEPAPPRAIEEPAAKAPPTEIPALETPAPETRALETSATETPAEAPPPAPARVVAAPPVPIRPSPATPIETAPRPAPVPIAVVGEDRWAAAQPLDAPLEGLPAAPIVGDGQPAEGLFALRFDGNELLGIARADPDALDRLAQRPATAIAGDPGVRSAAIDREAAIALAGAALAVRVRERHLGELEVQLTDLKSALPGLVSKLDPASQARAKALVHDLSRFVREAREHYASVVRKPVFHERLEEAAVEATHLWQALEGRARTVRTQLEGAVNASRFGEVQLERAVAQLRAMHDERRMAAFGARLVAAFSLARLAFGAGQAPAGAASVEALAAARRADIDAEGALLARLEACERSAKAPAYAGRGEFEKNRAAAREWTARLRGDSAEAATRTLDAAREQLAGGFLGGEATDGSVLWRCDAGGRVVEMRGAPAAALRPGASAAPRLAAAQG